MIARWLNGLYLTAPPTAATTTRRANMTVTMGPAIAQLGADMSGEVIDPAHAEYDDARRVWNAAIDARPALIARCRSTADVRSAVSCAIKHGLEIAVRGGGHSTSGASVAEAGMVIDLSGMRGVLVDPDARRARVGGGALLADLDAATQAHGLATPAGLISHTGVAGLTLGGGMGWLTRMAGLTVDNLISAEVVTADGRVLRATDDDHPDLFWALRGGGWKLRRRHRVRIPAPSCRSHRPVRIAVLGPGPGPLRASPGSRHSPHYAVFIVGVCPSPELLPAERAWVRSFWDALRPYANGAGSYVNAMTEPDPDRVRASYGPDKYDRLSRIKAEYDPANVFHRNVNIAPVQSGGFPPNVRPKSSRRRRGRAQKKPKPALHDD